ncbi:hypothetical protein HDU98_008216 [Podochytrium sp. JEL0797]|nr:hypothetical protein HDU98_008216 [Podochytrium sp. JEL0797]
MPPAPLTAATASVALRLVSATPAGAQAETPHASHLLVSHSHNNNNNNNINNINAKAEVSLLNASAIRKKTLLFDHCADKNASLDDFVRQLRLCDLVDGVFDGFNPLIIAPSLHRDLLVPPSTGKNMAVLTASVGKSLSQQERTVVFKSAFDELLRTAETRESEISFGYFGVTDSKLMNMVTERSIPADLISSDLTPLLSPLECIQDVKDLMTRESHLPTIFYFRVESMGPVRTVGTLVLTDLGHPCFLPPTDASYVCSGASVTKSMVTMKKIVSHLANPGFTGVLEHQDTFLTTVCSPFLGGNGQAMFVLTVDPTDKFSTSENEHALESVHLFKKIRSYSTSTLVDPRVSQLEQRCRDLAQEIEIQKDFATTQTDSLTTATRRLLDLQDLLTQTRTDCARKVSDMQKTMDARGLEFESQQTQLAQTHAEVVQAMRSAHLDEVEAMRQGFEEEIEAARKECEVEVVKAKEEAKGMVEEVYKKAVEERERDVVEWEGKVEALVAEKNELEINLETAKFDLKDQEDRWTFEKLEMTQQLKLEEAKMASFDAGSSAHLSTIDQQTIEIAKLMQILHESQLTITTLQQESVNLRSLLSTFQQEVTATQTTVDTTRNTLATTEKSLEETQTCLTQAHSEVATCRAKIENLQQTLLETRESHTTAMASLETKSQQDLARELSHLRNTLETQHTHALAEMSEQHLQSLRDVKKEMTLTGLHESSAAATRVDEVETRMAELERTHAREVERCKRKMRAEFEGDLKDMEAKLEECEEVEKMWEKDAERMKKALERAIERQKEFERDVDGEREEWEGERKADRARIQSLEMRLSSILETLKSARESQVRFPEDVHESIMVAAQVQQPPPKDPTSEPRIPKKRARMSDVSDLLEISAKVGKSVPEKRRARPAKRAVIVAPQDESDEEEEEQKLVQRSSKSKKSVAVAAEPAVVEKASDAAVNKGRRSRTTSGADVGEDPMAIDSAVATASTKKDGKKKTAASTSVTAGKEPSVESEPPVAASASRKGKGKATATEGRDKDTDAVITDEPATSLAARKKEIKKKSAPATTSIESTVVDNEAPAPETSSSSQPTATAKPAKPAAAKKHSRKIADSDHSDNSEDDDFSEPDKGDKTVESGGVGSKKSAGRTKKSETGEKVRGGKKKAVDDAVVGKGKEGVDGESEVEKEGELVDAPAAKLAKSKAVQERKTAKSAKAAVEPAEDDAVVEKEGIEAAMDESAPVVPGKENKKKEAGSKKRKAAVVSVTEEEDGNESAEEGDGGKEVKAEAARKEKGVADKKKRKLSAKASVVAEDTDEIAPTNPTAPKSPTKKPLFSFSKPSLSILPNFQLGGGGGSSSLGSSLSSLGSNPYNIGTSIDSTVVGDFDRQRKKRMEMLLASQSQS